MARHSKADAARLLGISRTTLYRLIEQGKVSPTRDGLIDDTELVRVAPYVDTIKARIETSRHALTSHTPQGRRMRTRHSPMLEPLLTSTPVVYVIAAHWRAPLCKIGVTTNLRKRLASLRGGNPLSLQVFITWHMRTPEATYRWENTLLRRYRSYRQRGEWIKLSPLQVLQKQQKDCEAREASLTRQIEARFQRAEQLHRRCMRVFTIAAALDDRTLRLLRKIRGQENANLARLEVYFSARDQVRDEYPKMDVRAASWPR